MPDEPSRPRVGKLTFLDNAVQDSTGTVKLRATIPNSDHHFWPGRFVRVRLVLSTLRGSGTGPGRAIVYGTKAGVRIKADPSKMWARGISVDDLAAAIKSGTSYVGVGQFDGPSGTAVLRPRGQLEEAKAYGDLIVSTTNGAPVYVRDVAQVKDSVQDERINMRFWARGYPVPSATVVVAVFRQAGANAQEWTCIDDPSRHDICLSD